MGKLQDALNKAQRDNRRLNANLATANGANEKLTTENVTLTTQNAELRREKIRLNKIIQEMSKGNFVSCKSVPKDVQDAVSYQHRTLFLGPCPSIYCSRLNIFLLVPLKIVNAVRYYLFRSKKFVNNDEKALAYCRQVLDLNPDISVDMDENAKKAWCHQYNNFMCQTFNKERTYVGNRLKSAVDWWRENVEKDDTRVNNFPHFEDLVRCVRREVDLTVAPPNPLPEGWNPDDPENVLNYSPDGMLFYWYWEHVCGKCLGSKRFPPNIRHYATLSNAKFHDEPKGASTKFWG